MKFQQQCIQCCGFCCSEIFEKNYWIWYKQFCASNFSQILTYSNIEISAQFYMFLTQKLKFWNTDMHSMNAKHRLNWMNQMHFVLYTLRWVHGIGRHDSCSKESEMNETNEKTKSLTNHNNKNYLKFIRKSTWISFSTWKLPGKLSKEHSSGTVFIPKKLHPTIFYHTKRSVLVFISPFLTNNDLMECNQHLFVAFHWFQKGTFKRIFVHLP